MRLLYLKSRKYKGKQYWKYVIILPNKLIKELGWKAGQDLKAKADDGKLIISKS